MDGKTISTDSELTITVSGNRTIEALFTALDYEIILAVSSTDYGTVSSGGTYEYNTAHNFTATANYGYEFDGWYSESGLVSSDSTMSYTVVGAKTITARFSIIHDATFILSDPTPDYSETVQCSPTYDVGILSQNYGVAKVYRADSLRYTSSTSSLGVYSFKTAVPIEVTITRSVIYIDGHTDTYSKTVVVDGTVSREYIWDYSYGTDQSFVRTENKEATLTLELKYSTYLEYREETRIRDAAEEHRTNVTSFVTYGDSAITYLADVFEDMTGDFTPLERAQCVLNFVQSSISYQYDSDYNGQSEYWKFPYETLYDQKGDCEDTSFLFAAIIKAMGYDAVMVEPPNHMAVAISVSGCSGTYYLYDSTRYYICETAVDNGHWEVGEIPPSYSSETATLYRII
ncbi:MAG: transglutaminase domain-containing protein [Methanomethylophilus sp.]|nr:transglutaminase domain-containing protein [Methanomethylophilus sp.]MDD4668813.1 transglutaminase domain-containing protein [Methanomethylophilus sp.]